LGQILISGRKGVNLVLLVLLPVLFNACAEKETKIVIFHTNDTHARLDNFPLSGQHC
jgi:2',3'-cyclic-nucleotide 2'-phosphodiesterase (5'-nucleotidase family)